MFIDAWLSLEMMDLPEETGFKKLTVYPSCYRLLDRKWWGFMFTSALHAEILSGRGLHSVISTVSSNIQHHRPPPAFVERTLFPIIHFLPLALILLMSLFHISLVRGECRIGRDVPFRTMHS